jgi:hypothetical protein
MNISVSFKNRCDRFICVGNYTYKWTYVYMNEWKWKIHIKWMYTYI